MTVEKFIEGYKKATDKERFVKKHIIDKYISYQTKIEDCNLIVDRCCYRIINNEQEFYRDSILQYFLFIIRLIQRYTDIELSEATISDIDELTEAGCFELIIKSIPEAEYARYKMLLDMIIDDRCGYEESITQFLNNKSKIFSELLTAINEANNGQRITES